MVTFRLKNPTEIRFGNGQIAALDELVDRTARVLLLYGGGSIKTNGVYDQVKAALPGRTLVEFGGIEPNPLYQTICRAAVLARDEKIDLVLGVGGGSVIDAAKFLATIIPMPQADPWPDLVAGVRPEHT